MQITLPTSSSEILVIPPSNMKLFYQLILETILCLIIFVMAHTFGSPKDKNLKGSISRMVGVNSCLGVIVNMIFGNLEILFHFFGFQWFNHTLERLTMFWLIISVVLFNFKDTTDTESFSYLVVWILIFFFGYSIIVCTTIILMCSYIQDYRCVRENLIQ